MNTQNQNTTSKKDQKTPNLAVALGVLVVVALLFIIFRLGDSDPMSVTRYTDGAHEVPDRPEEIPNDLPTDYPYLEDAFNVEYRTSVGAVRHYSMTYTSEAPLALIYGDFAAYMERRGYELSTDSYTEGLIAELYGTRDGADLGVVISESSQARQVQIGYTLRE